MRKIISIVLCLVMVLGTAANAFADTSKGSATTLRLEKTEGSVGITKSGGKAVTVKDGIRLYDGYQLKTDKKSAAYVSLDSSKAVMLDASTDVSIKKNGNKLDIMLKSGTILVNVEDKLKSNEELNIRTTNSVTGIRGTIAQFTYNPVTRNTEVYLFEGETEGMYLAPDGSWYKQTLTTGSWLASGMGMLADNPQFNGWTQGPDGEWIYTNNKLEGTEFRQWRWSAEQGWFTFDTQTGAVTKQEAWPFTFKDLQPKVQQEILNDESMLSRGQEHLDLYPELAEDKLPETKAAAEEALAQQQEEVEKQDAVIQEVFEEGNGGNTVDNLFENSAPAEPSVPTYAMVYLMDDPDVVASPATYTTQYYEEGSAVTAPADPTRTGYTFAGWSAALPTAKAAATETVFAAWTVNQYTVYIDDPDGTSSGITVAQGITTLNPDPVTGGYTVDYGTTLTATLTPVNEDPVFKVTDEDGTYYMVDGENSFDIPVTTGGDITLTVEDIQTTANMITVRYDSDNGKDLAPITAYSGQIASVDASGDGYKFAVEGTGGITFTLTGQTLDMIDYGIDDVWYTDALGNHSITPDSGDMYSATYTTAESEVYIATDGIYAVSFNGGNIAFTVNETWKMHEGDTYYYLGDEEISITLLTDDILFDTYGNTVVAFETSGGTTYRSMAFEADGADTYVTQFNIYPDHNSNYEFFYNAGGISAVTVTYPDEDAYTVDSSVIAALPGGTGAVYNNYVVALGSDFVLTTADNTYIVSDDGGASNLAPDVTDGTTYTISVVESTAEILITH